MNEEKNKNSKKIYSFFVSGIKKSVSPNIKNSYTIKHIKGRTFDIYSCLKDVIFIIFSSIEIVIQCVINIIRITNNMPTTFKKAAKNNFKLGLSALKTNNLVDARIRFLLSNMFYSKSAKTKYYIAYVYYRQRFFSKSLKYLEQSIFIDPKNKRSISLFKNIENEIKKQKQ